MNTKKTLLFLFLLLSIAVSAQHNLSGSIIDNDTQTPLIGGTIELFLLPDTISTNATTSTAKGTFQLKNIKTGNYLLKASYLGYETHWRTLKIQKDKSLKPIFLKTAETIMSVVEISGKKIPMKINGDTIAFNTAAFPTVAGDLVEDMLKKLPGVEIDRDGNIRAFGKNIENILVDGKPFFGSDVKIATQNLDAEAIEKVEVFDKKSDIAEFTGVDDGKEQPTINLTLKKSHKAGYFGNAEAGVGTDNRYTGRINFNRFKEGERLSFIGRVNNVSQRGFSIARSGVVDGSDFYEISGNNSLTRKRENGGLTTAYSGGINFNKKFSEKINLSSNFHLGQTENDLEQSGEEENVLDDLYFKTITKEEKTSKNKSLKGYVRMHIKLDSTQQLIFSANIKQQTPTSNSLLLSQVVDENDFLKNRSNRLLENRGGSNKYNGSITWRKKLKKEKRTLITKLTGLYDEKMSTAVLNSENIIALDTLFTDNINQNQDKQNNLSSYSASINFTEPIGKDFTFKIENYLSHARTSKVDDFADQLTESVFVKNDSLSTEYERIFTRYQINPTIAVKKGKYNATVGLNLQRSIIDIDFKNLNAKDQISANGILPFIRYSYKLNPRESWSVIYKTNQKHPTVKQLQPLVNNTNPLVIYIGNPDLKFAYSHIVSTSYMSFNMEKSQMIFGQIKFNYTKNKITELIEIDEAFRRIYRPVNVSKDWLLSSDFEITQPIEKLGVNIGLHLEYQIGNSLFFIENLLNNVYQTRSKITFSVSNKKIEKFSCSIKYAWRQNQNIYDQSKQYNQSFNSHTILSDFLWKINKKIQFRSTLDYPFYQQDFTDAALSIPLFGMEFSHYFLSNNTLKISLSAFDILNQNNGVSQFASLNSTGYNQQNGVNRYIMLKALFNLKKKKG